MLMKFGILFHFLSAIFIMSNNDIISSPELWGMSEFVNLVEKEINFDMSDHDFHDRLS